MKAAPWFSWLIPQSEREMVLGDLEQGFGDRPVRYLLELLYAAWVCRRYSPRAAADLPSTSAGEPVMSTLGNDLRHAIRQLRVRPGSTALTVLTLAVGIGATTATFSVVNPILFEALPYPHPDRIMALAERSKAGEDMGTGYATFVDVQSMATSFEAMAVTGQWLPTLQRNGEPERLEGQYVTQQFFTVLGVRPALGRDFSAEENVRGNHHVVILSYGLWQRRFDSNPAIIGSSATFDGLPYVIVGVMPKSFENLVSPGAQLWSPLGYEVTLPWACRTCHHLREYGRLKPGVAPATALHELDLIAARLETQYPTEYPGRGMLLTPLQELLTRGIRPALLAVLGAVGLVLLIACANVSSLLLGRAMQREGEFAIRIALGARRGRVVRQLLTESVVLAAIGGLAGVVLAWIGVRGLTGLAPANLPRLHGIGIDGTVLAFTLVVSLVTGVLFGLMPAIALARPERFATLVPGTRQTGTRVRRMARGVLVAAEVALAVMLLVGAGLLMRSLDHLLAVDPGFAPAQLLTMEVQTTGAHYAEDGPTWAFWDQSLRAVQAVPGVELAAWTSQLPLGGNYDRWGVQIEGRLLANPSEAPSADRYSVTADYLRTMGIPLRRGRGFTSADAGTSPRVVLINETLATIGWNGEDPIGRRVQIGGGGPNTPWRTVIGIVGNVHHTGLDEVQAPQLYVPEFQGSFADNFMVLAVRARGDPAALAPAIRQAIRSVDPTQPILHVATMPEVLAASATQRRFTFVLFQAFAIVALILSAAGIYGVLTGAVTERTREIGIRSALGASRGGLLAMVLRQGLRLTLAGMAVGTAGAMILTRFLQSMLFGVGTRDPLTFAGVVLLLLAVAVVACLAPALRATQVSPLEALKSE